MSELEPFLHRLRTLCLSAASDPLPLPGHGCTPMRHLRLIEAGREDLSLARLAEAHWDALAILAEANRSPVPGALYGVWASELPGHELTLQPTAHGYTVSGTKQFCSGVDLVDRALVTVGPSPSLLVEIDLRQNPDLTLDPAPTPHARPRTTPRRPTPQLHISTDAWQTDAFRLTHTGSATFHGFPATADAFLGPPGWYTARPGFWHGACGPAACWAGGAIGLVDFASQSTRRDPHTLAHLGAMQASVWALHAILSTAGTQIDADPGNLPAAHLRALSVRHLVEQASTDILRRFARAYGPAPLSLNAPIARRYHELDLYLRQSHAERDLESLATHSASLTPTHSP